MDLVFIILSDLVEFLRLFFFNILGFVLGIISELCLLFVGQVVVHSDLRDSCGGVPLATIPCLGRRVKGIMELASVFSLSLCQGELTNSLHSKVLVPVHCTCLETHSHVPFPLYEICPRCAGRSVCS